MKTVPTSDNSRKYQTTNPMVRYLIDRFLREVVNRVRLSRVRRVVDVGCGEGLVAAALRKAGMDIDYRGFDLRPEAVAAARELNPEWSFETADLHALPIERGWADMVLCLEVLEHLNQPETATAHLAAMTCKQALISVPWEPWFRIGSLCRGTYLQSWGNHPEHVQHFTHTSLRNLLQRSFCRVEMVPSVFPWILAQAGDPKQFS